MDQNYVALKLMLDELGVPAEIRTVAQRKTVQKAVYLGQAAGVDLGYRYNWYRMGPYSPGLTRDYFGLADALEGGENSGAFELQERARVKVRDVARLLTVPDEVGLELSEWLELLASVHYLTSRRRLDREGTKHVLAAEKQHVAPFADQAFAVLQDGGLIDAA